MSIKPEESSQEDQKKNEPQEGSSLFRSSAISSRNDTSVGKNIAVKSIPITITISVSVLATVLILLFVIFGRYTNRAQLTGAVIPTSGIVRIYAPRAGYITQSNIKEGTPVAKGQHLFTIAADEKSSLGDTQATILAHLRQQRTELNNELQRIQDREKLDKVGLYQQKESLLLEKNNLKEQIAQASEHLKTLSDIVEKYTRLAKDRLIRDTELYERIEIRMRYYDDLEKLRRDAVQIEQRLLEIDNTLNTIDLKLASDISEINRQINTIDREVAITESLRQFEISAPSEGNITTILAYPGQYVAAGTLLLSILPASSELEVHLFAESAAIGFIRENARVMLRYPAFPYQKFGLYPAKVKEVSRVTISQEDAVNSFTAVETKNMSLFRHEGLYRIVVVPEKNYILAYGKKEPLRSGMSVEADVFLDTRYVYEWLFEPLFSVRGF